jgi:hypothetical protein
MSWWNFGGLNPEYKEFLETHPQKTLLGVSWALYWRFILFVLALEVLFFAVIFLLAAIFSH